MIVLLHFILAPIGVDHGFVYQWHLKYRIHRHVADSVTL